MKPFLLLIMSLYSMAVACPLAAQLTLHTKGHHKRHRHKSSHYKEIEPEQIIGPTGPTGPCGIQGEKGPPGKQGPRGYRGATGPATFNKIAYAEWVKPDSSANSKTVSIHLDSTSGRSDRIPLTYTRSSGSFAEFSEPPIGGFKIAENGQYLVSYEVTGIISSKDRTHTSALPTLYLFTNVQSGTDNYRRGHEPFSTTPFVNEVHATAKGSTILELSQNDLVSLHVWHKIADSSCAEVDYCFCLTNNEPNAVNRAYLMIQKLD